MLKQNAIKTLLIGSMCYLFAIIDSPNFILTAASLSVFILFIQLFYTHEFPSFVLFGLLMQWLSVSIELHYCNFHGITLAEKYLSSGKSYGAPDLLNEAFWLNLSGIVAYAFGIWVIIRKTTTNYEKTNTNGLDRYNPKKIIYLYIGLFILSIFIKNNLFTFVSLSQLLNFILTLKWGFFFIMIYICIKQKSNLIFLSCVVLFEFILGFASYFSSSFLNILVLSVIAFLFSQPRIKVKYLAPGLVLISGIIYFVLLWTSVKEKYRMFLNQGSREQIIKVDRDEALQKFTELAGDVTTSTLVDNVSDVVDRVGYIAYFSNTLQYVPTLKPHQDGAIYWNAVSYYFKPRLFFPEKPAIDDSKHTAEYTGLFISGKESGTSISLGYVPDAYIDFGAVFMFFPLLLLGICTGWIYRYFFRKSPNMFWAMVLTTPFFFLTNINGMNADKVIGALLIYTVFGFFTIRFLPKYVDRFIMNPK
jgi:hypothetical protein